MPKTKTPMSKTAETNSHPQSLPSAPLPEQQPVMAKAATRLIAMLYDGMLILAMLFFVQMLLIVLGTKLLGLAGTDMKQAATLPLWYRNIVQIPAFVIILVGFYGVFWRKAGQTLGMQTWRLKTMNRDGSLLSWRQSMMRILAACLLPVVCGMLGYLIHQSVGALYFSMFIGLLFNYWFAWVNKQGLALHDLLSNTVTMKMPKINHEGLFAGFRKK